MRYIVIYLQIKLSCINHNLCSITNPSFVRVRALRTPTKISFDLIVFSECVSASWSCSDSGCGNDFVCPSNQIHSKHVTSCEPTCSTLHFLADEGPMDHICTGPSWSGCKCPPGLVREGDDCIDPDDCPCLHNGKMYESGASISRDCNTCICARRNWECSKPGFLVRSIHSWQVRQSGKLWKTW